MMLIMIHVRITMVVKALTSENIEQGFSLHAMSEGPVKEQTALCAVWYLTTLWNASVDTILKTKQK